MSRGLAALLLALAAGGSQGAGLPPAPVLQRFGDWTVACDNLRRCTAEGNRVQDGNGAQAGLRLSREAGPQGAPLAQLHLSGPEGQDLPAGSRLRIQIDGRNYRSLPVDNVLPPARLLPLLKVLLEADSLQLSAEGSEAMVSLEGIKAALLKMDDVQGRVGTVTAWVAKGPLSAGKVPPAPPLPVLVAAPPPLPLTSEAAKPLLLRLLREPAVIEDCYLLQEESGHADSPPEATLYAVGPDEHLLFMTCAFAPYQTGYRLWRVKQRQGAWVIAPEALPNMGQPALDLMNADLSGGELSTWAKLRGQGDCGSSRHWIWTGSGFALRSAVDAPDCNGEFGGGLGLELWRTELRTAPGAPVRP